MQIVMLLSNDLYRDARVQRESRALVAAGHQVTVVATKSERTSRRENLDGINVIRVDIQRRGPAILWNIILWPWRFSGLADEALALPMDVLHAHDLDVLGPARRLARRRGVPLVYDSHELFLASLNQGFRPGATGLRRWLQCAAVGWMRKIGHYVERRGYRQAVAHITTNESYSQILGEMYGPPPPLPVDNYPPYREAFGSTALRDRLGIPAESYIVLYQGNFTYGRGLEQFLDAIAQLEPFYEAVLIGWGWIEADLREQAQQLGVSDRVHFVSTVPASELLELTMSADLGIMTTDPINDSRHFCTSNKLFEYLMAGLPVVVSDLPENRKVLERYPVGELLEGLDPQRIAGAIRHVFEWSSQEREEARELALRAARESYCWELQAPRLLGVYENLDSQ